MLQPNNPDIDFQALERIVRHTADCRRHAARVTGTDAQAAAPVSLPQSGWRQRVRAWPVAGPLLARIYHRVRRATAPGLSLPQRVRAMPGIGEIAVWLHALATLPRWRRELRNELAVTRSELANLREELAALRITHAGLMQDVGALRAQRAAGAQQSSASAGGRAAHRP